MNKELRNKLMQIGKKSDEEMKSLARLIFWQNNPSYEDFQCMYNGNLLSYIEFVTLKFEGIVTLKSGRIVTRPNII